MGSRRWLICGLLFFATTVNYMDRQVLALLKPTLQLQFGWTEIGYSNIVLAFQLAYGVGLLFFGKLIDKLGTRKGFSLAVLVWSAAAMAHATASSVFQFAVARFSLGLGEAGSFPASVKAVAEWFPKRERALATGLFNSGSNLGAIVPSLVVPWITLRYGWRMAFIATGALGFVWLLAWLALYRRPDDDKTISAKELAYIRSDREDGRNENNQNQSYQNDDLQTEDRPGGDSQNRERAHTTVPFRKLLTLRQAWAIALGKFFTDPIWWVYLFWMPDFLNRNLGLNLAGTRLPLFVIYSGACVGSIGGGWLSGSLLKRGWTVNRSRKTALLACALAVTPIMIAAHTKSAWLAVLAIAIAAGAHQGWSANIYTLVSDMFPKNAVGSVVGFGTVAGAIGGMLVAKAVGYILQGTGSYVPVFLMAGLAYLVAFGFVQLLAPRLEPAEV
jgi:ACS family hexuronate transporter-like MFS transporter